MGPWMGTRCSRRRAADEISNAPCRSGQINKKTTDIYSLCAVTCWMFCTTRSASCVTFFPRKAIVTRTK